MSQQQRPSTQPPPLPPPPATPNGAQDMLRLEPQAFFLLRVYKPPPSSITTKTAEVAGAAAGAVALGR